MYHQRLGGLAFGSLDLRRIHYARTQSGAQGICAATHHDLLRGTAPTSAYAARYRRPWLLGGSHQHRHMVDTSSFWRGQGWLLRSCWLFSVAVGWYSAPGVAGVNPGRRCSRRAPSLYHFGQAHNPRRLVRTDDASTVPSLALPMATCWQGWPRWVRGGPALHPALRP